MCILVLRICLSNGACIGLTRSRAAMGFSSRDQSTLASSSRAAHGLSSSSSLRAAAWNKRRAEFSQAALTCLVANKTKFPPRKEQRQQAPLTTPTKSPRVPSPWLVPPRSPPAALGWPSCSFQACFSWPSEECKALGCSWRPAPDLFRKGTAG